MSILSILEELAETSSRLKKEVALKRATSTPHFKRAVLYALDPYRRYYVKNLDDAEGIKGSRLPLASFGDGFRLLDDLAARRVTGNAARTQIREMLALLTPQDGEVFKRILLKDLRCGVNSKIANTAFPGLVPVFELQAAAPYDEAKAKWPMYAEPKVDGMRVMAVVQKNGDVEYLSRGGMRVFTFEHVTPALQKMCGSEGAAFDCEGALDGAVFESAMSAVKRGSAKEGATPVLHVFDVLTLDEWNERRCERPWRERNGHLNRLMSVIADECPPHLRRLTHAYVSDDEEAQAYYERARRSGYEGAILKDPQGLYEFKRTRAWQKMKPAETLDVEITGVKEGGGKYRGMLGALTFKHRGLQCSAGSGLSDEERVALWKRHKRPGKRAPLVGLTMEVEFTEPTAKGRTRHARFVRLREHDGERD